MLIERFLSGSPESSGVNLFSNRNVAVLTLGREILEAAECNSDPLGL